MSSDLNGSRASVDTGPPTSSDPTIAAKEREVERQREQLAETVDALHAKLDVKAQARARVDAARARATTPSGRPRPEVLAGAAVAVLGVVVLVWWRRR
ncbi:DUF3618 domain-containing protein [Nocardioides mesophilus]|uniref:DUF3618 domain-containing protein n=1 Tax=Nocardioides mesophilus TaxID=433659 RepID=A0A7G9R7P5_9ACTN|nr:DUF3618 domain-containing protein [Nocardioides mesophilus]QNN51620.1 DUF3618 domain-containing protein [Nocardioides mesophilus]